MAARPSRARVSTAQPPETQPHQTDYRTRESARPRGVDHHPVAREDRFIAPAQIAQRDPVLEARVQELLEGFELNLLFPLRILELRVHLLGQRVDHAIDIAT